MDFGGDEWNRIVLMIASEDSAVPVPPEPLASSLSAYFQRHSMQ
jgi:hypothetical protein